MQECKIKKLEEAKILKDETINEIKRDSKRKTAMIIILIIASLIICFGNMKLSIDYEALKQEKEAYEDLVEMQKSMIADLEENCDKLYIELENERAGGNIE